MTKDLGFEPGVLGTIFAGGGLSSLFGARRARRSARRFGLGPSMWGGLILMGVSLLFIPLAQGATVLGAAFLIAQQFVGDGGATVFEINQVSLRQSVTPERMLGRANAAIRLSSLAAMLMGSLAGEIMGETVGLRPTLIAGAGATFAAALWIIASPARGMRDVPVVEVETA